MILTAQTRSSRTGCLPRHSMHQWKCARFWCRFSSGSIGKASRASSNAARLGLLPEEPEEDEDMYEAPVPASDILVDGFIVPKVGSLS